MLFLMLSYYHITSMSVECLAWLTVIIDDNLYLIYNFFNTISYTKIKFKITLILIICLLTISNQTVGWKNIFVYSWQMRIWNCILVSIIYYTIIVWWVFQQMWTFLVRVVPLPPHRFSQITKGRFPHHFRLSAQILCKILVPPISTNKWDDWYKANFLSYTNYILLHSQKAPLLRTHIRDLLFSNQFHQPLIIKQLFIINK